jgi:hypothetical protein
LPPARAGPAPGPGTSGKGPEELAAAAAAAAAAGEVCGLKDPGAEKLRQLEAALAQVVSEWGASLARELHASHSRWAVAFQDVLLRRLVLRFVLARALLQLHAAHGAELSYQPACFPELPACAAPGAPEVLRGVRALVEVLGCAGQFRLGGGGGGGGGGGPEIVPL